MLSVSVVMLLSMQGFISAMEGEDPISQWTRHYIPDEFELNEEALVEHVLKHSQVRIRPRVSLHSKTDVDNSVMVIATSFAEDNDRALGVLGYFPITWKDHRLEWDPENYSNITQVRVRISDVWHPDMVIYNAVEVEYVHHGADQAIVFNDGTVLYVPAIKAKTVAMCSESTPTKRVCHMKIGSWTYSKDEIDPTGSTKCDTGTDYIPNKYKAPGATDEEADNEWKLTACDLQVVDKEYPEMPGIWPHVKVTFTFHKGEGKKRRRSEDQKRNFVMYEQARETKDEQYDNTLIFH